MSQIKFRAEHNGQTVDVMAGWDRPLQGFYLTIFNPPDAEEECLYSNLDDKECSGGMGFMSSTSYFKTVLNKFGITAPEGFWELVEKREGNVIHMFKDGSWK